MQHRLLDEYNYPRKEIERLINTYRQGKIDPHHNIIKGVIKHPNEENLGTLPPVDSSKYKELYKKGKESLRNGELGMVILNGGMATRFGGVVKGAVEVFDGKSFLELKLHGAVSLSSKIKFYIMNSFSTEKETKELFEKKNYFGNRSKIWMFNQYIAPRITVDGKYFKAKNERQTFYGPGHGDFPYAFRSSGLLDKFIDGGGKYIFFSNVDNLGAKVDAALLGFHIKTEEELTAEVSPKFSADVGGAPAVVNGKLQLVEGFSFPKDFDAESIGVFNCATYWVNALSLKKEFILPWYLVEKKVNDTAIIQFEHLAGDMTRFLSTGFIKVPREKRFLPVKTPSELKEKREELRKLLKNKN